MRPHAEGGLMEDRMAITGAEVRGRKKSRSGISETGPAVCDETEEIRESGCDEDDSREYPPIPVRVLWGVGLVFLIHYGIFFLTIELVRRKLGH
jgi:hypothetical protein